jgi:hypothetical protein
MAGLHVERRLVGVAAAVAVLWVGACGSTSPNSRRASIDLSSYEEATTFEGPSEFRVVGPLLENAGLGLFKVHVVTGAVETTPDQEIRTLHAVDDVDAFARSDGAWVVLATGCEEDLDAGGKCADRGTALIVVDVDGHAREVGRVDTGGARVHLIGVTSGGRPVVRLGVAHLSPGETAADPQSIPYEQSYATIDPATAELSRLDSVQQALLFPSVIADPSKAASSPFLSSCATRSHLAVLVSEQADRSDLGLVSSELSSHAVLERHPVEIPEGWIPDLLLCEPTGVLRLVLRSPSGNAVSVADLGADGKLRNQTAAPLTGGEVAGVKAGPTSVVVDVGPANGRVGRDGSGRRVFAFNAGIWHEVRVREVGLNPVIVSDDGSAVLVREGKTLRVIEQ